MTRGSEISSHEVQIYQALRDATGHWMTAGEIGEGATVASRTARHRCLRLVDIGVFERARVFPAYKYRLRTEQPSVALSYVTRLEDALKVFV
jgi:hypothetical protein